MADTAHVSSIEAIESFRASLIVYLSKMRPLLEDACDEVARTREWLRTDRRIFWENQVRRRTKALEQAQQALFSAELTHLRAPSSAELIAVQKARRAAGEADEKLRRVKRWAMDFDNRLDPLVKQIEALQTMLIHDGPKAVMYLGQIATTLEAYAERGARFQPPAMAAAADGAANETQPPEVGLATAADAAEASKESIL